MDVPKPVYQELLGLVKDKDCFVITTNVDHCFQKAGFDRKRLFYTQGDYGLFQCSEPCCQETFENEGIIRRMMDGTAERNADSVRASSGMSPLRKTADHEPACG